MFSRRMASGVRLGDFLDLHAAGGAGHEDDLAGRAINQDAEVEFAFDVDAFFDEQTLDDAAAGAGLDGDQVHAQHVAGDVGGFVGGMRELDAAGLAAAAGMDLRLYDNDGRFQAMRAFAGLFLREGNFAARDSDAVAGENRFGLILVNLHRVSWSVWLGSGQPVLEFFDSQNTEVYSGTRRRGKARRMRWRVSLREAMMGC